MSLYGWMGKILRVNLSKRNIINSTLTKELRYNFLGGRGINSKILYDETGPETEPLGPENRIIIGTGPVTGTLVPSSGRFTITAKSPLTGILGNANTGGFWAPELKYAGYDHIVIWGRSKKPVYLSIDDHEVEIRDASHLWGRNTWETERMLKEEIGDERIHVLSIGQAGENMVKYACTINDECHAAGRCGIGAVFGSKNLKAIAVRGSKSVRIAYPEKLFELVEDFYNESKRQTLWEDFRRYGTTQLVTSQSSIGSLRVRNFQSCMPPEDKIESLSPEYILSKYKHKKGGVSCFSCHTSCGQWSFFDKSYGLCAGRGDRPEGGTLNRALMAEIASYPVVAKYDRLCNQYGMDTFSTAAVISAAMEWYERGIITQEDTEGINIKFGDEEVFIELVHKIAAREGFGNILAEGSLQAGKVVGADEESTPHIKRLDALNSDLSAFADIRLAYSVSNRGCDHLRGTNPAGWGYSHGKKWNRLYDKIGVKDASKPWVCHPVKADITVYFEDIVTACNLLEMCVFNGEFWTMYEREKGDMEVFANFLSIVTGLDINARHLGKVSRRVQNIEKAYNIRLGLRRKDDYAPPRYLKPVPDGSLAGTLVDPKSYEKMLDRYYEAHGWDPKTSIPTRSTLEELELKYVADDLEQKHGIQLE